MSSFSRLVLIAKAYSFFRTLSFTPFFGESGSLECIKSEECDVEGKKSYEFYEENKL